MESWHAILINFVAEGKEVSFFKGSMSLFSTTTVYSGAV